MLIPQNASRCLDILTGAGFEAYCVGGCVRDDCLGKIPHDYDLCTSATPEQMKALFAGFPLVLAGEKHGTVGVVMDGEVTEITVFRSEGGYTDGRHPGWVSYERDILADLSRRDFTINAMAYAPGKGIVDPFGGREDLENKCLRCVGQPEKRFREDALRILRGVRFAARFHLTPEQETEKAMFALRGLMDQLARERVYTEMCGILLASDSACLSHFSPVLTQVVPELEDTIGYDQQTPHHLYDLFTHIALTVAAVPADLILKWAALLHDCAKIACRTTDESGTAHYYGHDRAGARRAQEILSRLKAPAALKDRVCTLITWHMIPLRADKKLLRRRVSQLGQETVEQLLALQIADRMATGTHQEELAELKAAGELLTEIACEDACLTVHDLSVNGADMMALGLRGRQIGDMLRALLELVLEEKAENTRKMLLSLARQMAECAQQKE